MKTPESSSVIGPETSKSGPVPEETEGIGALPDDFVRLAREGLERVAALNPSVDPSQHVNTDTWFGHKKIKPTRNQIKE